MTAGRSGHATGVVTGFDVDGGWGTVRLEGSDEVAFHCTAISDGTRRVEIGTEVTCTVGPGRSGGWEAVRVVAR